MDFMFNECHSLTNLNLSNFNTQNVDDMMFMLGNCFSLKEENIITKDDNIIVQFQRTIL